MIIAALLLFASGADDGRIEARFVLTAPVIDGILEEVWTQADSSDRFCQCRPDDKGPPSQKTVVFVLADHENLYVAFRCYDTEPDKLVLRLRPRDDQTGDKVGLWLDTFGDKTTAYDFEITAGGVMGDCYIAQDGQLADETWDGVWFGAARRQEYGYTVEIKIPYKSIRFKPGLAEWGVNFYRVVDRTMEEDYWFPQRVTDYLKISRSGIVSGIRPAVRGQQMDFYPVGLMRYEEGEARDLSPDGGLDFFWSVDPSSKVQLTFNPDFAQIEADPFQLNLTKYELWLQERRPFFTETQELFSPPYAPITIGEPIALYYSRRIGRSLPDGKAVPILSGLRYSSRFERFQAGVMGVACAATDYECGDDLLTEPQSYYAVARLKRDFLNNSEVGLLYAGKENNEYANRAMGVDGVLRHEALSFSFQGAGTMIRDEPGGWGGKVDAGYQKRNYFVGAGAKEIGAQFDPGGVALQPWKGRQYGVVGGVSIYNWDQLRKASTGAFAGRSQEAGESYTGSYLGFWATSVVKDNLGFAIEVQRNDDFEVDREYETVSYSGTFWTNYSKPVYFSGSFYWSTLLYNYRREYFAPSGSMAFQTALRPRTNVSIGINMSDLIECDPTGAIVADNVVWWPRVTWSVTNNLHLRLAAEPNFITDVHSMNVLLSYNFRPKSWIYVAFNETRATDELTFSGRAAVVKVRYLIYF